MYEQVINLDVLNELFVQQRNVYSQQNRKNFFINFEEMKALIGVNYIMAAKQVSNTAMCWDCDHFVGNVGIQNISARTKYQEVLQNLHFANSTKQGKTYKKYKVRPVIDHLNKSFEAIFSSEPEQSIDEHITKFKGRSSMKQCLRIKRMKWGLNGDFDVLVPLVTSTSFVCILVRREILKST